ncbi:MAG: O-antigen ligase family protein [Sedimentisphaerales bacterium]|nr:O-antigen ligase family protein [Sedimentisphaerales bacterium]
MTAQLQQNESAEKLWIRLVDMVLLIFCAVVIAGRCQINEAFPFNRMLTGSAVNVDIAQGETVSMVVFSGLIWLAGLVWLLSHLSQGSFGWCKTSLVIPLVLFSVAAVISTMAASNQHKALVSSCVLLSQMILAMLLVQLLNSPAKQRLLLCVVVATGVTVAYRCLEQFIYDMPAMMEDFARNPNAVLATQGIEPGSYEAANFAGRIASGDIGGFFAISNTVAAFFILSIMASVALLLDGFKRKMTQWQWLSAFALVVFILLQIAALFIIRSKGGIVGCLFAMGLMGLLWFGRKFFCKHRNVVIAGVVVLIALTITTIAMYGSKYGRLPTLSMWVRWQYWQGAAQMIADHWFTGVGGENFATYYRHYVDAAAPEVVADPHCFFLALWSQWGLLALIGLVVAILAICFRLTRRPQVDSTIRKWAATDLANQQPNLPSKPKSASSAIQMNPFAWAPSPLIITVWAVLVLIGIVLIRLGVSEFAGVSEIDRRSVFIISFAMPAAIWLGAFLMSSIILGTLGGIQSTIPSHAESKVQIHSGIAILILSCGILGFLLHNCIDFAIFHPGVGTLFFALIGVVLAIRQTRPLGSSLSHPNQHDSALQLGNKPLARWLMALAGVLIFVVLLIKIVVPICRSQNQLGQAEILVRQSNFRAESAGKSSAYPIGDSSAEYETRWVQILEKARDQANLAAETDSLNPEPTYFCSKISMLLWLNSNCNNQSYFEQTRKALEELIKRNRADHNGYKFLSEFYLSAAGKGGDEEKNYAQKALTNSRKALERYPVKSEMLISHADLLITYGPLLQLENWREQAIECLQKALDNEEAFLQLQRQMYPQRQPLIPRLSPEIKKLAQQQLLNLQKENF